LTHPSRPLDKEPSNTTPLGKPTTPPWAIPRSTEGVYTSTTPIIRSSYQVQKPSGESSSPLLLIPSQQPKPKPSPSSGLTNETLTPLLVSSTNPTLEGGVYASLHKGFWPNSDTVQQAVKSWIFFEEWSNWEPVLESRGMPVLGQTRLSPGDEASLCELELPREVSSVLGVGTAVRMQALQSRFSAQLHLILALSLGEKPRAPARDWFWVQHRECDGVTSGGWWCWSTISMPKGLPRLASVRRLCHVIYPVPTGPLYRPQRNPEMYPRRQPRLMAGVNWEGSLCKTNGFFPIDKLNAKVICPSIFGGYVVRNLTPTELMDCLDISADHQESFLQR
jgi:hypothetical protein